MGITYAYGLFAHVWQVPGGWLGLREAHVHANAWGFLGLAAIGTLYDLPPAPRYPISTVRGYETTRRGSSSPVSFR